MLFFSSLIMQYVYIIFLRCLKDMIRKIWISVNLNNYFKSKKLIQSHIQFWR